MFPQVSERLTLIEQEDFLRDMKNNFNLRKDTRGGLQIKGKKKEC